MNGATAGEDAQWYALRVQPQKEYVVGYLLRRKGIRTFIPTEMKFRKRNRYAKGKSEFAFPIIPGRVFAGFDGQPEWFHILKNPLILGPIGMDGHPWQLDLMGKLGKDGKRHDGLFEFLGRQIDGCLVLEDGKHLVHVQGRGLIRAPIEHSRTISMRTKRGDSVVVEASRRDIKRFAAFVLPEPSALLMAAE